ncbi:MAG: glycosyltransferase family 2 protein [Candidatus Micrarchaeia archaeon]
MPEIELSIVLPCYNEEKNIPAVLERLASVVSGRNVEVVLVNNGSLDNTGKVLKEEISKNSYKFAKIVKVEKNIGYGFGVMEGLRACKGKFLAFSHADLQCDPGDIIKAYGLLVSSPNPERVLVKGNRHARHSIISTIFLLLSSVLFLKKFSDINAQPKVFHNSLLKLLRKPPNDFTLDFYVQWAALMNRFKVAEISVEFPERKHGKSNWSSTFSSRLKSMAGFVYYLFKLRIFGD